ncbi:hypothetical protein ROV95_11400 [Stenotrophomonas maltophilia group sp. msm1]|uniref:hypothetical protein n=1 Tax=Stenotrophomonas maltophilia group sp. msm1 TaxID=3061099 RepID=UPI0028938C6F|nr:hypothetical protein [Stenotrophomonas maltophilia group sp. msm1]MDT3556726.1 hypothetical protein [Stenotrophomonas maltophilia group sp. msm1]
MDWVALARTLATEAHAGQMDKAGQPYIGHVARVAAAVLGDDDAEVVAWLHDVAEDCPAFAARIEAFPAPLREAVHLLKRAAAPTRTATTRALPPTAGTEGEAGRSG